jgi:molybdenum cofactor biosynthesis protein B
MKGTSTEHKMSAPPSVGFSIITISTSRFEKLQRGDSYEDLSAELISKLLIDNGHRVIIKEIIPDQSDHIRSSLEKKLDDQRVEAIITSGGTGITSTDVTVETVRPLLDKFLPGFGELFRKISYEQIGSAAVLSRSIAGLSRGKAIFCLPGSPHAVETALNYLIIPEISHIIKHVHE